MFYRNTEKRYQESLPKKSGSIRKLIQGTTLTVATLIGGHASANIQEDTSFKASYTIKNEERSAHITQKPTPEISSTWLAKNPVTKKLKIHPDGTIDITSMYGQLIQGVSITEANTKTRIRGKVVEVLFMRDAHRTFIIASAHINPEQIKSITQRNLQNQKNLAEQEKESQDLCSMIGKNDQAPISLPTSSSNSIPKTEEQTLKNSLCPELGFAGILRIFFGRLGKKKPKEKESGQRKIWFLEKTNDPELSKTQREQLYHMTKHFLQKIKSRSLISVQPTTYTPIIQMLEQVFHQLSTHDIIPINNILLRIDDILKYFTTQALPTDKYSKTYTDIEFYLREVRKHLHGKTGKMPDIGQFLTVQYQREARMLIRDLASHT